MRKKDAKNNDRKQNKQKRKKVGEELYIFLWLTKQRKLEFECVDLIDGSNMQSTPLPTVARSTKVDEKRFMTAAISLAATEEGKVGFKSKQREDKNTGNLALTDSFLRLSFKHVQPFCVNCRVIAATHFNKKRSSMGR